MTAGHAMTGYRAVPARPPALPISLAGCRWVTAPAATGEAGLDCADHGVDELGRLQWVEWDRTGTSLELHGYICGTAGIRHFTRAGRE